MKLKSAIKIVILTLFTIVTIFILNNNVEAAGIEGTTIVVNPRAWR